MIYYIIYLYRNNHTSLFLYTIYMLPKRMFLQYIDFCKFCYIIDLELFNDGEKETKV